MKKLFTNLKVALTLLLLCGVCSAWAGSNSYTITFKKGSSDTGTGAPSISSGSDYATLSSSSYAYERTNGMHLSSGKNSGNATITMLEKGKVAASSIVVNALAKSGKSFTVKVTYADNSNESKTFTPGTSSIDNTFELSNTNKQNISSIYLSASSGSGTGIAYIKVVYVDESKELKTLEVSGAPNKTTYDAGETFDPAGLVVTGTYDDTSTADITDEAKWTFTPPTFTSTSQTSVSVTATVDGKSDTKVYAVTVAEHVITPGTYEISLNNALYGIDAGASGTEQSVTKNDITIVSGCTSSASSKTYYDTNHIRYYAGSYLKLSVPEGYEITQVTFVEPTSDKKWDATATEGITVNSGTYTNSSKSWAGFASELNFSFSKQCRAASIKVTYAKAKVKTLKSISVTNQKTSFYKGDEFEFGGTVTASYEEDDVENEIVTGQATFEGYDMSTAGTQTVTVTFNEKQTTYQITVNTIANTLATAYTTEKAIELIDAGKDLASEVYVKGRISEIVKFESGQITYWLDDKTFQVYHGKGLENASFASADDIEVGADVVVYGKIKKYNSSTYEFVEGNYLVSYSEPAKKGATIELTTYQTEMKAGEEDEYEITYNGDGELSITSSDESVAEAIIVENTVLIDAKANGSTTITISAPETDNYFSASKTYTLKVVGPASLPFAYDEGKSNLAAGMTATGLGTDYSSSPKLKFDDTNDNLVIWFGEQAGYVTYDIKGNGSKGDWSGTFDVMESADGVEYTTVASYTVIESTTTAKGNALKSDSRYVKFVYVTKTNGNVALGNICINKAVTISDAGWATAYVPFNATVSDNAIAYYVTGTNGNALTKVEANVIPAGEGVLLKSNNGGEAMVTFTASTETADAATGNLMKGSLTGETFSGAGYTYYILTLGDDDKVGFYWDWETNNSGASAICEAGKAILAVPANGGSAKKFFYLDDDATGINSVEMSKKNNGIRYNLNGQAVGNDFKGVVIVNGKKFVK